MLESQLRKLQTRTSQSLSIGISADGAFRRSISIPWKHTSNAFNMRTPDVYLTPADLDDPEISALLAKFIIRGCYIFDPLEDYSFLRRFPQLWDVSIARGTGITDISFMEALPDCFLFYIEDARIPTLEPLAAALDPANGFHSRCIGFCNCEISDIRALEQPHVRLSELVVIRPQDSNEKSRWQHIRAGSYSYYEYK